MKKEYESLRFRVYSVKGQFRGRFWAHVDILTKDIPVDFWLLLLRGKKVPNSKCTIKV